MLPWNTNSQFYFARSRPSLTKTFTSPDFGSYFKYLLLSYLRWFWLEQTTNVLLNISNLHPLELTDAVGFTGPNKKFHGILEPMSLAKLNELRLECLKRIVRLTNNACDFVNCFLRIQSLVIHEQRDNIISVFALLLGVISKEATKSSNRMGLTCQFVTSWDHIIRTKVINKRKGGAKVSSSDILINSHDGNLRAIMNSDKAGGFFHEFLGKEPIRDIILVPKQGYQFCQYQYHHTICIALHEKSMCGICPTTSFGEPNTRQYQEFGPLEVRAGVE